MEFAASTVSRQERSTGALTVGVDGCSAAGGARRRRWVFSRYPSSSRRSVRPPTLARTAAIQGTADLGLRTGGLAAVTTASPPRELAVPTLSCRWTSRILVSRADRGSAPCQCIGIAVCLRWNGYRQGCLQVPQTGNRMCTHFSGYSPCSCRLGLRRLIALGWCVLTP